MDQGNGAKKLRREIVSGEPYEYSPITKQVVIVPGICGGRPTFKLTRIDVHHALGLLGAGRTIQQVAMGYSVPVKTVQEALDITSDAFDQKDKTLLKQA